MLGTSKKSSRRLSSLFLTAPSDVQDSKPAKTTSSTPVESSSRLTKVKQRVVSAARLAPEYPPPSARTTDDTSLSSPAIQPRQPRQSRQSGGPEVAECSQPATVVRKVSPSALDALLPDVAQARGGSRPSSANGEVSSDSRLRKARRKSRLFGGSQSSERADANMVSGLNGDPPAWIVGHPDKLAYDLTLLLNGEQVPELWDEQGDTLVYLFPPNSGKGPSFRIDSSIYAASQLLTRLVHGSLYSGQACGSPLDPADRRSRRLSYELGTQQSRTVSPARSQRESSDGSKGSRVLSDAVEDDFTEKHLYLPIHLSSEAASTPHESQLTLHDIDTLVAHRNFFAFLIGQSLVATPRFSVLFDIFVRTSDILSHLAFSNVDGSSFGEVAASSFNCYVDELMLADVRSDREKTIEAVILGERMRSLPLYTEGFVHAAGQWNDIKRSNSPRFSMLNPQTTVRIARAAMDLETREATINGKLKDFEFPNVFAGIMNSATASETKIIRFKKWKSAFMTTRTFIIDYYKAKYGSWLPKAKSKKNDLTTSGLNRLVLLEIYRDMSSLYDLLVNKRNLTIRTADGFLAHDEREDMEAIMHRAMRKVLSEYDRSTPPVQPPIPFDLPLYPTVSNIRAGNANNSAKTRRKKMHKDSVVDILKNSHNQDAEQHTPFLEAFQQFERKQASGVSIEEMGDLRSGQWLFLYAVIQSLPMLVVDAPGVRFTEGVEYFLCQMPRSGIPWGREDTARSRTWFGVAGGGQVVNLPTDVVEHGVEGIFRRSHCWRRAQQWTEQDTLLNAAMQELSANAEPLPAPPSLLDPSSAVRSRSPSLDPRRESIMLLGLEALPLPPGVSPPAATSPMLRPISISDSNKTFDDILGSSAVAPKIKSKDKKKKK